MDKVKIGLPRSIFYYEHEYMWKYFFEKLGFDVLTSVKTNQEIIRLGEHYSNDEMCLSMKIYFGHVASLMNCCDYILTPRIDNYGLTKQTCTNFLSIYDLVKNIFNKKLLHYNIDYIKGESEKKAYFNIGKQLGKSKKDIKDAYTYALIKYQKNEKRKSIDALNRLNSERLKILLVGHDYNIEDELIGKPIINYLSRNDCEIIKSYELPKEVTVNLYNNISSTLYWKQNRENVGAIEYCKGKVDGIILLSSFPCGCDSIVNELIIRRVKAPILNIVIDDLSSFSGFETRLESFLDIIKQKCKG